MIACFARDRSPENRLDGSLPPDEEDRLDESPPPMSKEIGLRSFAAMERAAAERATLGRRGASDPRGTRGRSVAAIVLLGLALGWTLVPGLASAGAPGPEDEPMRATTPPAPPAPMRATTPPAPSEPVRATTPPAPPDPAAQVAPSRVMSAVPATPRERPIVSAPRPRLDPSARMLSPEDATEAWTLFVELESGHRITQRFLLSNQGPGKHNAVAVGHFFEPGRAPYRYVNGRRRARWKLSDDRLFFDIAASHLDLHRPKGELRITKDDIEIRLFFDFREQAAAAAVPAERLPPGYHVEVLAIGADTRGSVRAPWMPVPLETHGRTWLVHTWSESEEQKRLDRRVEFFGHDGDDAFYAIHLSREGDWESAWALLARGGDEVVESAINVPVRWNENPAGDGTSPSGRYPTPSGFSIDQAPFSGSISLSNDWLRFDPLEVIPQPFRWFIRRKMRPQEVWAEAQIGVSLFAASDEPPLPHSDAPEPDDAETPRRAGWIERTESSTPNRDSPAKIRVESDARSSSQREMDDRSATGSVKGVSSITFLNPRGRR